MKRIVLTALVPMILIISIYNKVIGVYIDDTNTIYFYIEPTNINNIIKGAELWILN